MTQKVQVTSSVVHVETANTELGDVIKTKAMELLPILGRGYANLLGFRAGVTPNSYREGT